MLQQLISIAIGGAAGSMLRFAISTGVYRILGRDFPYGTLVVNVFGSLLMGYLFIHFVERQTLAADWRPAILVGMLGAMTTFSTFSMETMALMENGEVLKAVLNVMMNILFCLVATWFGMGLGRQL